MSWVSSFLKKTAGIPEIDLLKIDFVRAIVARNAADLLKKDIERLPDEVFRSVLNAVAAEAYRRAKDKISDEEWEAMWNSIPADRPTPIADALTREGIMGGHD